MSRIIRATPLYKFIRLCNGSSLEKVVLDCGAGGSFPPLSLFYEHGYETHGIDISDYMLNLAYNFCKENNLELGIIKGDMRKIPFEDASMSFVFSYNTIFHMTKKDIEISIKEIERVLKKGGLCFVNFLSVDDLLYGRGEEQGKGEFLQVEDGEEILHTFHEDNEPESLFSNFEILHKEKRLVERPKDWGDYRSAFLDYIVQKR